MRLALVDTLATILFFTTAAALTELFVAGMEPREVLITRSLMIPVMIATGRPYGAWRDVIFAKTQPRAGWAKTVVDACAFLSFQLPVYAVTLAVAGADGQEILTLLGATAVLMVLLSRPFGLFLEMIRTVARVRAR
ncbi:MAG: L-alanine exporter AlaE [Alphaproteobacteria bacterium]|nr:L-alanine exporter AlaE [Alphaproteobacteria bacterium]NNF23912.1 L-alanine exporter AlaE [Paracoccaceae bacterium]